jgi:hypothetical protein
VKATTTAAATLRVPPYRYHLPGVVLVMMTLPLETGMDSTNDVRTQPIPGSTAPLTERVAHAPRTQVARITAQLMSAAAGTGPAMWLYWKLPISPCTAPNRNSTPYTPTETGHCGSRLRVVPFMPAGTAMPAGYCANRSVSRPPGPVDPAAPARPRGPASSV